ncbi:hypothetical protein TPA0910_76760 [Streptomyces hygroscopicus subsp. sporocinereus]|uniref:Uncharacterized protein n=1 Tax=Streptomyces hygroscopicus TaxID=1912 RepID=A0ABQ3UCA0_STRHY|nr:hypothetical protein TPA0910_76760 [Streptomyces hygroscopicus]
MVALYPCAAKTSAAVESSSRRRSGDGLTVVFFSLFFSLFFALFPVEARFLVEFGTFSFSPHGCWLLTDTVSPVMYEE